MVVYTTEHGANIHDNIHDPWQVQSLGLVQGAAACTVCVHEYIYAQPVVHLCEVFCTCTTCAFSSVSSGLA